MIDMYIDNNKINFYNFIKSIDEKEIQEADISITEDDISFLKKAAVLSRGEIFDHFGIDGLNLLENNIKRYSSILKYFYKMSLNYIDEEDDKKYIIEEISFFSNL